MNEHSCDLCANPAVIHDTLAHGGVVNVRHLCRAHGIQEWRAALPWAEDAAKAAAKDPVLQSFIAQAGKHMQRRGGKDPAV